MNDNIKSLEHKELLIAFNALERMYNNLTDQFEPIAKVVSRSPDEYEYVTRIGIIAKQHKSELDAILTTFRDSPTISD